MTPEDFKQLEELLGKLGLHIGVGRYCIIPGHISDGYHVATYSPITGMQMKTGNGPTVEEAIKSLK